MFAANTLPILSHSTQTVCRTIPTREVNPLVVAGKDLVEALIQAGHGRAYDGGKRGRWCN